MHAFNYLVPALFWNATVERTFSLGNPNSGGTLGFTNFVSAALRSEPGYEPSFTSTIKYGGNYVARDTTSQVTRITHSGVVFPDDGATPFEMVATGILIGNPDVIQIVTGNSTTLELPWGSVQSVWIPAFKGGSGKYAALQDRVFVSSETFSASTVPNQFFIALKISQVFSSNTSTTIRNAFSS